MRDSLQITLSALPQVERVRVSTSTRSAIRLIAEIKPALVVYDADLPNGDMPALLDAVNTAGSRSLVIADDREQQLAAEATGASAALLWGYPAARLIETAEELLQRSTSNGSRDT